MIEGLILPFMRGVFLRRFRGSQHRWEWRSSSITDQDTCYLNIRFIEESIREFYVIVSNNIQWHSEFKSDRQSAELIPHGGRPRTARTETNINTVATLIADDPKFTLNQLSMYLNIFQTRIQAIPAQNLQMRRQCLTWVPHRLNAQNLQTRVDVCKKLL